MTTPRRSAVARPAAVLAFGLLAVSCAGNTLDTESPGGASPQVSAATSSTPTETPAATDAASPTAETSPLIEDGRNFAFVKSVDTSAEPATVKYDLAYFLTGEEAVQAAKEHGDEAPPPNDYYIVNDNPRLRTAPLAADVDLVFLDWDHCCDVTFPASLTDFARALDEGEMRIDHHVYKGRLSPYWLIARDGQIVRVEEQYLP
jgi:hypothetical protein